MIFFKIQKYWKVHAKHGINGFPSLSSTSKDSTSHLVLYDMWGQNQRFLLKSAYIKKVSRPRIRLPGWAEGMHASEYDITSSSNRSTTKCSKQWWE